MARVIVNSIDFKNLRECNACYQKQKDVFIISKSFSKKENYLKRQNDISKYFSMYPQHGGRHTMALLWPARKWPSQRKNVLSVISYKLLNLKFCYYMKPTSDKWKRKSNRFKNRAEQNSHKPSSGLRQSLWLYQDHFLSYKKIDCLNNIICFVLLLIISVVGFTQLH